MAFGFQKTSKLFSFAFMVVSLLSMSACGIQDIPQAKNSTEATFSEISNQYKRRADLVPNLVKTVKGYASHEKETLDAVTSARARATSMNIDPSKATPEQLQKYQEAQGSLSQALGKLLMISENYPNLKADQNFRDLQAQLEGTENRIAIARQRHIEAINRFNNLVMTPPYSWTNSFFYHYEKMPQWNVPDEERNQIENVPQVEF